MFHAVLGDVPNGTNSRGFGWESPKLPPGFTHGSDFPAFFATASACDPAARCPIPGCCEMSLGTTIQVILLEEVAWQRTDRVMPLVRLGPFLTGQPHTSYTAPFPSPGRRSGERLVVHPTLSYRNPLRLSHLWNDDWTYIWEGEAPAELHYPHARQEPRPPVRAMLAPGM